MSFTPIDKMMERVNKNGDSDPMLFHELLYAGEFITKVTTLALIASIDDDRENHHYRLSHSLVRATGIGHWLAVIDEICTGPVARNIAPVMRDEHRVFGVQVGSDNWQYDAVREMHAVLAGVNLGTGSFDRKTSFRTWFTKFVEVRNKTRGHGAPTPATCAKVVKAFQDSIRLVIQNNPMFQKPWAYLHQNLSGKYKVIDLGGDASCFEYLKKSVSTATPVENYQDGVYLWVTGPRLVPLLCSDIDATDFFVPNGGFNEKTYELHSPITDDRRREDAGQYLAVPSDRPASETAGARELSIVGNVYTNMPDPPAGYVKRPQIEQEIRDILSNDRFPVVTLVGRGGIGKTSLALTMLHEIAKSDRYHTIIWFSARDIDLTPTGAKVVQASTLTEKEIIKEYSNLITGLRPEVTKDVLQEDMRSATNGPTLFVFDNFETVRNPTDLYQWINTNIRPPNTVLITSRFQRFKADYPITVSGMEYKEAEELIRKTAAALNIRANITSANVEDIIEDSDRHPYVIKIVLGEVAVKGSFPKPERILARKEDLLEVLFERTYNNLSPLARRLFLTLSGWRSLVLQLAAEALLHLSSDQRVNPQNAVDELLQMSLIERLDSEDEARFLKVPIAAALFGRKKLEVSQDNLSIRDDIQFLQELGPTKPTDLKNGAYLRVRSIFKKVANDVGRGHTQLERIRPMLEFIAQNYPPAWLLFADLEGEVGDHAERQIDYLKRSLEEITLGFDNRQAWYRLAFLYRQTGNVVGCLDAFLRVADIEKPDLNSTSSMVNYVNYAISNLSHSDMDSHRRASLLEPLRGLMEQFRRQASATDLSRLSWLHIHLGDPDTALSTAREGLEKEPENLHCQRIVTRLTGRN